MLHFDAVPKPLTALLAQLAANPALDGFSLGGGTSLALRFGHRVSVDLDFFTTDDFQTEEIFDALNLTDATIVGRAKNSLSVDAGGVKLDLLRHGYRMLEVTDVLDGIRLISVPDLAAMKLNALANRGSKKDFYDLVELANHFSLREMLAFFTTKYPATDPFTVIRSLAWFDDAEVEPDPLTLNGRSWTRVKEIVLTRVAEL